MIKREGKTGYPPMTQMGTDENLQGIGLYLCLSVSSVDEKGLDEIFS